MLHTDITFNINQRKLFVISDLYIKFPLDHFYSIHKRTGRVLFGGGGGGGGGGGLKSLARILLHYLHKNQVVLPKHYLIFCSRNGYLKNSRWRGGGGGGDGETAPPPTPWPVRL